MSSTDDPTIPSPAALCETTRGRTADVENWLRTRAAVAYDRAVSDPVGLLTATELRARLQKRPEATDGVEPPKPLA